MSSSNDRIPTTGNRPFDDRALSSTPADETAPVALDATLPPESSADPALAQTMLPPPKSDPALSQTLPPEETPSLAFAGTLHARTGPSVPQGHFPVANWERYDFVKLLGQGGMGAVYQARDKRLNRTVALKFIRGGDPNMVMRFMQEARTQARIDHPHVCKVYEVGEVQGRAYIAMQFVDGKPLDKASTGLSLTSKVVIMQQVAEAMHEAHRLGIIHRDLKPSNIMLEPAEDGSLNPLVMDFGLARESSEGHGLTETGAVMGTPAYMAPEQARGDTRLIDRRSDVYSLGATLYDLIVGIPPFDAQSVVELLLKVVTEDARPLRSRLATVPPDLETIVMKCLHKDPSQRYDSAKALAEDLGRYINGEPILGRRLSLFARLRRRAQRNRTLVAVSALSLLVVLSLSANGLRQYFANQRERQRTEVQARIERQLAQDLGQQITQMEWVLRSARQLPLHDLSREKVIVRERMAQLQSKLKSYGELSRGLGHYALGRGHMALHEYPQALTELKEAMRYGVKTADVDYALGFVLGKHFEQAMYEARLSGGGDWAKKQLKDIEPKYLTPAIDSLERSRAVMLDSPSYLEGLIAYYKREYEAALKHAEEALKKTPWLYDASKLTGDIHLERALQARDSGRYEEAEKEFAAAVQSFQAAAAVGQSDGEVYEGLAEAWVRQIEMALQRGQKAEEAYTAAMVASDRISIVEPHTINGPLKKAFASMMTMAVAGGGPTSMERVEQCLAAANTVLEKQPGHPYASDAAAGCQSFAAEGARARGEDPEPLLRRALRLMETTVQKYPKFLWGVNDLGNIYFALGTYLQLHGSATSKEVFQKALDQFSAAAALDPTYLNAPHNALSALVSLTLDARSEGEIERALSLADTWLARCKSINSKSQQCFDNYFQIHARAASRALVSGQDPRPSVERARASLAETRKLGGDLLDAEQHAALTHWVEAADRVGRKSDPGAALSEMQSDLGRCFVLAPQDAMCRTLAAQGEWIASDWLALQHRPNHARLERAIDKALQATQSPETYPDAWQVLAEAHLRVARALGIPPALRERHVAAGLVAVQKVFSINPNHALGHATQGALLLLRAEMQRDPQARRTAAQAAVIELEQAVKESPFLAHDSLTLIAQGKRLTAGP